jgi:hypothetical protein
MELLYQHQEIHICHQLLMALQASRMYQSSVYCDHTCNLHLFPWKPILKLANKNLLKFSAFTHFFLVDIF